MAWIAQFDTQMLRDGYTPTEAMVYGYLWRISKRNIDNNEWVIVSPSISLMKKTLNISERAVIYAIEKLEKTGLISVERHYKSKSSYIVDNMDKYQAISNKSLLYS